MRNIGSVPISAFGQRWRLRLVQRLMPRAARIVVPGVALHIVQRGNNRAACFFSDSDRLAYLRLLLEYSRQVGCAVHAYCLMTNHVHLLVTPQASDACGLLMKHVGQHYVEHVNRVHARTGTLWEGRFKSSLVASAEYVLACYRYIELNPVRAGLSEHPRSHPWSSYRANAEGAADSLLEPHPYYTALEDDPDRLRRTYRQLFDAPMETELLSEIRAALRAGTALGSKRRGRGRPPKENRV
jgi:putative transposase